jgi:hypothetical protein
VRTYSYSVIKFASNPLNGESLNIGAVIFDEQARNSLIIGFDMARVSCAFGSEAEDAASRFLYRLKENYHNQSEVTSLIEILRCFPDQGTSTTFSASRKLELPEFITIEEYIRSTFVSRTADELEAQIEAPSAVQPKPEPAPRRKPATIRYPKLVPGT